MWLAFLTHQVRQVEQEAGWRPCPPDPRLCFQLPSNLYKKVLLMLHESVLPHMSHPPLMLDFLTAAYDQGEFTRARARWGHSDEGQNTADRSPWQLLTPDCQD